MLNKILNYFSEDAIIEREIKREEKQIQKEKEQIKKCEALILKLFEKGWEVKRINDFIFSKIPWSINPQSVLFTVGLKNGYIKPPGQCSKK